MRRSPLTVLVTASRVAVSFHCRWMAFAKRKFMGIAST